MISKTEEPDLVVEDAKPAPAPKATLGSALVNRSVETSFGRGKVLDFRTSDGIYVIELSHENQSTSTNMLYTPITPTLLPPTQTEAINTAYQALEQMRRFNLEVTAHEHGIFLEEINHEACTTCLLQGQSNIPETRFPRLQKLADNVTAKTSDPKSFPRLRKLGLFSMASSTTTTSATNPEQEQAPQKPQSFGKVLPRIQRLLDERQKAKPCLICASPSCPAHSSASFRKEHITLCTQCERLFELNFIVDCVNDHEGRAKHIDHMMDCYDRCLLLLQYSSQYAEEIAASLESLKSQHDQVQLGSSGVGVLSGVLGIAAAATILTPAGPPLLVASLLFGGSASAVQTGHDVRNYYSEPNQLADRILALKGMVLSILRVTSTLRDAMLRDQYLNVEAVEGVASLTAEQLQETLEKNRAGVLAGANMGRTLTLGGMSGTRAAAGSVVAAEGAAVAGAEAGAMSGARSATVVSRSATAAARTVRFARFAGGALSAAVLVMEANAIQSTLRSIHDGSPCDKAESIRQIASELKDLPTTADLDEECQAYLEALASRPRPPPEVAAVEADRNLSSSEFPQAECQVAPSISGGGDGAAELAAGGALIVDGQAPVAVATETTAHSSSSFFSETASSFLGRLQQLPQPLASSGGVNNNSSNNAARGSSEQEIIPAVAEASAVRAQEQQVSLIL